MLLYIIRHGDPDYANDSLTERGKLQAEAVGQRLYRSKIDRIYSSPMGRARMTAEPACRLLGLECNIEEWSHEIGNEIITKFPDGKAKAFAAVQNTYFRADNMWDLPYSRGLECNVFADTGMVSAVKYIEENGNNFLERLGYKAENGNYRILQPNEEKVALFCHAAFARTWISILLRVPIQNMTASFDYTHTGVTVLRFANFENGLTAPRCLCYNDMSHLYAHGPDLLYQGVIDL